MKKYLVASCLSALLLSACGSSVKQTLGLERTTPDEFSVVERAPLTVPPNFDLAPPSDGATAPSNAAATTKNLVLGSQSSAPVTSSRAEQLLLQKTGEAAPNIRQELTVDKDIVAPQTAAEKLGIVESDSKGKALDPIEEAEKLKAKNIKTVPVKPIPEKK